MTKKYQLDRVFLDLGDIGLTPATVDGRVTASGFYLQTEIERVVAHIPGHDHAIDVTLLISSATRADLEEKLEHEYVRDTQDPLTASDDFEKEGA